MTICVVAEIGVNHNGSLDEALWLVDMAKASGADVAKFQLWENKPELAHLRLSKLQIEVCSDYCHAQGLEFMCTPFDTASMWYLVDKLGMRRIKLASSAIFNEDLIRSAERARLPVILSTGMATHADIDLALCCLRHAPSVTLLHCVSGYPVPIDQANLRAIRALEVYGHDIGYSDHTGKPLAICAAAALGSKMIEMHLTRDCEQEGPDHSSSHDVGSFAMSVEAARTIEVMLGDGSIKTQDCAMFLRRKFA